MNLIFYSNLIFSSSWLKFILSFSSLLVSVFTLVVLFTLSTIVSFGLVTSISVFPSWSSYSKSLFSKIALLPSLPKFRLSNYLHFHLKYLSLPPWNIFCIFFFFDILNFPIVNTSSLTRWVLLLRWFFLRTSFHSISF